MEDHRLGCFVWDFRQDRALGRVGLRGRQGKQAKMIRKWKCALSPSLSMI